MRNDAFPSIKRQIEILIKLNGPSASTSRPKLAGIRIGFCRQSNERYRVGSYEYLLAGSIPSWANLSAATHRPSEVANNPKFSSPHKRALRHQLSSSSLRNFSKLLIVALSNGAFAKSSVSPVRPFGSPYAFGRDKPIFVRIGNLGKSYGT